MAEKRRAGVVDVVFPVERDIATWARRHRAGEVPGRWPYGLEALQEVTSLEVNAISLRSPRLAERALAALPRPLLAPRRRDVGLAWDENLAKRMIGVRPHREMYAGVIWTTDAASRATARGEPDPRLPPVRRILRRLSGVFVLSRGQLEPLQDFLGEGGPRVGYVRFGVDSTFYPPSPYPDRPLVVSIGGDRDRDAETLFDALARVHRAAPEVEMIVQSTSELPAPEGVTKVRYFTHHQLRDLYARASLVAIATRPNLHASGMTVSLEAMATARPVVITATPGLEDYVADGVTGHLVPVRDAQALSDRVLELLRDPDRAEQMGAAGRQRVDEAFTTRHLVSDLVGFMELPRS